MQKIYALLVGINDYAAPVTKLRGCINDVDHLAGYLNTSFDASALHIEVLKNADATRANIIGQIRSHLGRAQRDDIAIFQYCGHGARWASAQAFRSLYPGGKDEGLVCYDSRRNGVFDLADKELAVLLGEVSANDPHLAVIMDCCHSGSVTRSADDFVQLQSRQTFEVFDERPLETYLDGYYERLQQRGEPLLIPESRHVLMAACTRLQQAWETHNHSGVFSDTLLDVLEKSDADLSYADLFVRCRAAVRRHAQNQDPQFETYGGFNAWSGFLGEAAAARGPRHSVYFKRGEWTVDCGAVHGLPTDADARATFTVYSESDKIGRATAKRVGAQISYLALGFEGEPGKRYRAEVTSLPTPPQPFDLLGDRAGVNAVREVLDPSIGAQINDQAVSVRYRITAQDGNLILSDALSNTMIQGVTGQDRDAATQILSVLKHVLNWQRNLALQNNATRMDTSLVDFWFAEDLDDGTSHDHVGHDVTFDYSGKDVSGEFRFRNRTQQTLHVLLLYFSPAYEIRILKNDPIEPTEDAVVLSPGTFNLDDGVDEAFESLKLFVTTEKVDDFILAQEALTLNRIRGITRGFSAAKPFAKLAHRNEWFTKNMNMRILRQQVPRGAQTAKLANGAVTLRMPDGFRADVGLGSAKSVSRGGQDSADFWRALEQVPGPDGRDHAFELLNLAPSSGGEQSVLELANVQQATALSDQPMHIELNVPLADEEYLLPLTFDGEHVLLAGQTSKDEEGRSHVLVDHLATAPGQRRSLGGALKLYFFKTYLRQKSVNRLRWVEYHDDGTVTQHRSGVAEKVSAASNVLVLIHGIIGDTKGMAAGLSHAQDSSGSSVSDKFDLVLTYDYENLATPLADTASDLKRQLAGVGLVPDDDKQLTLLVHSMGGLVSRWFVEQLDGDSVVDHLVMCGTPNGGSPYGVVGSVRTLIDVLTAAALNTMPVLAPYLASVKFVLERSKKVTPCLEQMSSSSEFMRRLNADGKDPGVRYTILAGNVAQFDDDSGKFMARLLAKAGKGVLLEALFGTTDHDIAVSQASSRTVTDQRKPAPEKVNVACHHLNHFASPAGLDALSKVSW